LIGLENFTWPANFFNSAMPKFILRVFYILRVYRVQCEILLQIGPFFVLFYQYSLYVRLNDRYLKDFFKYYINIMYCAGKTTQHSFVCSVIFKTTLPVKASTAIVTKLYFENKYRLTHLQFTYSCQCDNYIHQHIPTYFSWRLPPAVR
jgi:hypothetical protein